MPNMPEHTPAPTPSRAVYGFAMYLSFRTFFVLYIIWAIIPESWFKYVGITCLPQRYWAIAVPIYIITAILLFGFIIYPSINLCMTPNFDDFRTITDETIKNKNHNQNSITSEINCECVCTNKFKCGQRQYLKMSTDFKTKCIPSAEDLDITEVSRILYSKLKSQ